MEFLIKKEAKVLPHKKHWQFCVGSGDARCMFYYGGNVTPPADYEAWNEPDLNPIFFAGTKEDYFRIIE